MLNLDTFRAIGMVAARNAREKAAQDGVTANEVISMTVLLKSWKEGPQTAGEVVAYNGAPYKVVQTHDSTGNPDWNPEKAPAMFAPYHATVKEYALPYVAPTGAHDAYMKGEWMIWKNGTAYECQQDACVYDPDVLPSAWEAK